MLTEFFTGGVVFSGCRERRTWKGNTCHKSYLDMIIIYSFTFFNHTVVVFMSCLEGGILFFLFFFKFIIVATSMHVNFGQKETT